MSDQNSGKGSSTWSGVIMAAMNDPPTKSAITSALQVLLTIVGTWAVARGLLSAGEMAEIATALVTLASAIGVIATFVYKARQVTPSALIEAVNKGDNGVKVVDASVPETVAPTVSSPLK